MWSYFEYIWPNAQRNWPNACAFNELRLHLVTVGKVDQMRSAFGQTSQPNWPNARTIGQTRAHFTKRFTNWSDALRI